MFMPVFLVQNKGANNIHHHSDGCHNHRFYITYFHRWGKETLRRFYYNEQCEHEQ